MSWVLPAFLIVVPFSDRLISSADKTAANILSFLKPERKKGIFFLQYFQEDEGEGQACSLQLGQQFTFAIRFGSAYAIPAAHDFEARSGRVICLGFNSFYFILTIFVFIFPDFSLLLQSQEVSG